MAVPTSALFGDLTSAKVVRCLNFWVLRNICISKRRPLILKKIDRHCLMKQLDDYLEGREVEEKAAEKIEGWYLKTQHKRHMPINVYDEFWK